MEYTLEYLPVQLLDGVGAGLLGVATPGMVARLLEGGGHINMGLGMVLTIQGIGAALSSTYGGLFAHHSSYDAAFFLLQPLHASDSCYF